MKFGVMLVSGLVMASTIGTGGLGAATTASATTPSQWAINASYPPVAEYLEGVACNGAGASAICEAVGFNASGASILSSVDGGQDWSAQLPPPSATTLKAVSCPSAAQCVTVGDAYSAPAETGTVLTTTDGGGVWTASTVPQGVMDLTGVSCPSTEVCEAVGISDLAKPVVLSSTNGGVAWSEQAVPSGIAQLSGVSCSSSSTCDAVGSSMTVSSSSGVQLGSGVVIATTNEGAKWSLQSTPAGTTQYSGIDCPASSSTCVAVGAAYELGNSGYPIPVAAWTTNAGETWAASKVPAGIAQLFGVSCALPAVCEVAGVSKLHTGLVLGTADAGSSWTEQTVPAGVSGLPALSCASVAYCAAVGFSHASNYTAVAIATTDGGSAWSPASLPTAVSNLAAVSCADVDDCTAVGFNAPGQGVALTTDNGSASWAVDDLPAGVSDLYGVACPVAADCVAVGDGGGAAAIVGTSDDGATWTSEPVPSGSYVLSAVACPGSTEECDAVGYKTPPTGPSAGVLLSTTDGGTTWTMGTLPVGVSALYGISCDTDVTDCVAVGASAGQAVILATSDGVTWEEQSVPADVTVLRAVDCPVAGTCAAAGWSTSSGTYSGVVLTTTNSGGTWSAAALPAGVAQLTSVSCLTATTCEAAGTDTSGDMAVVATTDGATWVGQNTPTGAAALDGISCAGDGAEICVGSGAETPGGAVLVAYDAAGPAGPAAHSGPVGQSGAATARLGTLAARSASNSNPSAASSAVAAADRSLSTAPSASDWTAYLDGGEHTSYNAAATAITPSNVSSLELAWRWLPPSSPNAGTPDFEASPTVAQGVVYAGSTNGYLFAVSEATHQTIWSDFLGLQFPTGTCGTSPLGITSTATVATNPATGQLTVYDNGANGWLYAIDALTGAVEWKALGYVPGVAVNDFYAWSSPLVANGRVYLGLSSDCDDPLVPAGLVSFDQSTGAQVAWWDSLPAGQIGASVWSTPTVAPDGDIFTDTGNGPGSVQNLWAESIVRLDPNTLQELGGWQVPADERKTDGDFGSTPTMFTADINGTETAMVGACNKNGLYYAFAQDDLSAGPVWSDRLNEESPYGIECDASATWNGTDLIEGSGGLTVLGGVDYAGSVEALDPATGALLWQTGLDGPVIGSTAEDAGGLVSAPVFATGARSGMFLLNGTTGALLGRVQTGGQEFGQGVFAGSQLVVADWGTNYGIAAYQVGGS